MGVYDEAMKRLRSGEPYGYLSSGEEDDWEEEEVVEGEFREVEPEEPKLLSGREPLPPLPETFGRRKKKPLLPRWMRSSTVEEREADMRTREARIKAYQTASKGIEAVGKEWRDYVEPEDRKLSMKKQLQEALSRASTDEEKVGVYMHFIQKLMRGGRTYSVAKRSVDKMLEEIQREF